MAIQLPDPSSRLGQMLQQALSPGEAILAAVLSGESGMSLHSALVATNLGVVILKHGASALGLGAEATRYPYWQITNVNIENLPFGSRVEISSAGTPQGPQEYEVVWSGNRVALKPKRSTAIVKVLGPNVFSFKRRHGRAEAVNAVVGVINEQIARALLPASQPSEGIPEQIRQLAALRDAGVLSNEEFEAKKAELLSRM